MGLTRRHILALAAGTCAGVALSPAPWRAVRDLTLLSQDPPWNPGPPRGPVTAVDTVSLACPSAMGIRVLVSEGRPVLVRGNPDHPLSAGTVTQAAQAEAYALHHPGRVRSPLRRGPDGRLEPVSWTDALELLAAKIKEAGPEVMAVDSGSRDTLRGLLAGFLNVLGSHDLFGMPSEADTARAAITLMGGSGLPGYDLDNAPGVVAIGADAFGSMPAAPHFMKAVSARKDARTAFCGPFRGATAALCSRWIPTVAGTEAVLAMGVAARLAGRGYLSGSSPDLAEFAALAVQRFPADEVAARTGVSAEDLDSLALDVLKGSLPVPGSSCGQGLGAAAFMACLGLSVMTGRVNRAGGLWLTPDVLEDAQTVLDLPARFKAVAEGLVKAPSVLLIMESDPAGSLPESPLAARAVKMAGFKVILTPVMNASAALCDLILPTPMPLERWGDAPTPYGLAFACRGVARPLVRPWTDARHPGDVLIDLASRLGKPLGPVDYRQALRRMAARLEERGGYVARGVPPWDVLAGRAQPAPEAGLWKALEEGGLWADPRPVQANLSCGARFLAEALAPAAVELSRPFTLALRSDPAVGRQGVLPQSLTQVSPSQARDGLCVARMNAATSRKARVEDGGRVTVSGPSGSVKALLEVDESVMDGHVVMTIGLAEVGGDALEAASFLPEAASGLPVWAGCRVSVERV